MKLGIVGSQRSSETQRRPDTAMENFQTPLSPMPSPPALLNDTPEAVAPEVKERKLFEALCAQLEAAIQAREKALEELGQMKEGRTQEPDGAASPKERDKLAAELATARKARDEFARQLADAEQNHRQKSDALKAEHDRLAHERHESRSRPPSPPQAYEQEIAFMAHERDVALKRRDSLLSDLDLEKKARSELVANLRKEIDALTGERDTLAASLQRERTDLSGKIATLTGERDQTLAERDSHSAQLAKARQQHAQELQAITDRHDHAAGEQQRISSALAQFRDRHEKEIADLQRDRGELTRARDDSAAQLTAARGEHRRDLDAFTAEREHFRAEIALLSKQRDDASVERDGLTSQLAELRESAGKTSGTLTRERDELSRARGELTGQLSQLREAHAREVKAHIGRNEKLAAELAREHHLHLSDSSTLRETHGQQVERLTAECATLTASRDELRAHLGALHSSHRQDLETARREHIAIANECEEARALLDRDHQSWRRQIDFFTEERDTLTREREEAFAELAHERQTLGKQLDLRARECDSLAKQRTESLAQIEVLRTAQNRQGELFSAEREVLLKAGEEAAAKLDLALKSLGMDRVTLLQARMDAVAQLDAGIASHRETLAERERERDAALQERDTAHQALTPFHEAQQREVAALGTVAARKHELGSAVADDGLHTVCNAKDLVLHREVEIKVIRNVETSPEQRRGLLDEARRLARLQHPNIPAIYEVGLSESGQVFYTMKAVRGITMREMLDQLEHAKTGAMLHFTLKRLLSIFHKICDALAFAHAQGITHGGVRPECIVLGDFGEVFVTQWRLPRAVHGRELDIHEDIASLGRLLYEIVTLEPVDESPAPHPGTRHGHTVVKPSLHWAGEESVRTLVDTARRALDRKAADKFSSVREFQTRVDVFKDAFLDPTQLTLARLFARWMRQHKVAIIIIGVLLLALTTIVATGVIRKMLDSKASAETQVPANPEANQTPSF